MVMAMFFASIGYFMGSILFAHFFGKIFGKDILTGSKDGNPGTANAYTHGGFWCGTLTLLCDVAKGFVPVFLYFRFANEPGIVSAFVLAAPVLGHIFPIFHHFRGGKGIATTFGCLFGLLPDYRPFAMLAFFFILYSVVVRLTPHFFRTAVTYFSTVILLMLSTESMAVKLGFLLIVVSVGVRLWSSKEKREKSRVRLLWMH